MKWIIVFTILCGVGVIWLLRKAIKDGKEEPSDGTIISYPDLDLMDATHGGVMFISFPSDEDEHSPENTISDDTLKRAILRNKLQKIDEERHQDDVDLDYQREDGK
jgi:hypothetical protein